MNETIRLQIAALEDMRLPELQARYAEVLGEATRCPNRRFIIRKLTDALLQAQEAAQPTQPEGSAEPHRPEPAEPAPATPEPAPVTELAAPAEMVPADEPAHAAPSAATESVAELAPAVVPAPARKLSKLTVPELQARYLEVVGRPTSSSDRNYLVWKVRQAEKGKVPVGPRRARQTTAEPQDHKVLPLRLEAELVARLDEARERLGLKNRMSLFRAALHDYLAAAGEPEVAALFAPEA